MADRNPRTRHPARERSRGAPDYAAPDYRQEEQFSPGSDYDEYNRPYDQMGESRYGRDEYRQPDPGYATEWDRQERYPGRERGGYAGREREITASGHYNYGPARVEGPGRGFASFTSEDQAGRDFTAPPRPRGYGWQPGTTTPSGYGYPGATNREGYYREEHDRGFLERAGDEIASWFGDEDAARRREMDHTGRGPQNYTRSDERILEDACDNLTDDWGVDARNIQVTVKDRELTLDGTVPDRRQKRRAEDRVEWVSGVRHVQNNLRVQEREGIESSRAEDEKTTGALS